MREIASADLFVVSQELKSLKGLHINNFYDLGAGSFRIDFEHNRSVYIKLMQTVNETKLREHAGAATPFAIAVRKRIIGMVLKDVLQHGLDRTLVMELEGSDKLSLILEMFAKGNLIVVGSDQKIKLVYAKREFKDRVLAVNASYSFAPSESIGIEQFNKEGIERVFDSVATGSEDVKLIQALSKLINLGPLYLDNAIRLAGLDPNAPASTIKDNEAELSQQLLKVKDFMLSPSPVVYLLDGKVVDYAIMPISKYAEKGYAASQFSTLSELLDFVYADARASNVQQAETGKELEELDKSIEKQKELADSYAKKALLYKSIASKIFEHMQGLNAAIEKARDKNADVKELSSIAGVKVISIDRKNKTMRVVF